VDQIGVVVAEARDRGDRRAHGRTIHRYRRPPPRDGALCERLGLELRDGEYDRLGLELLDGELLRDGGEYDRLGLELRDGELLRDGGEYDRLGLDPCDGGEYDRLGLELRDPPLPTERDGALPRDPPLNDGDALPPWRDGEPAPTASQPEGAAPRDGLAAGASHLGRAEPLKGSRVFAAGTEPMVRAERDGATARTGAFARCCGSITVTR
jgi:hypothetical protein